MKKCVFAMAILISFVLVGCSNSTPQEWRTDVDPISKRFPLLAKSTSLFWKGELLGTHSAYSFPGKYAYRVRCYVLHASEAVSILKEITDFERIDSFKEERPSFLKIDKEDQPLCSRSLEKQLKGMKYSGCVLYFKKSNILYFNVFWE